MSLRLLCEQLAGISPEAKFFLLKFLQHYGWVHPVTFTSKELVKSFGIHDKGVKNALIELCDRKYLTRSKSPNDSRGRGRPKQVFAPGEGLADLAKNWAATIVPINNELIIKKLLEVTPEREKITKPLKTRLLASRGGGTREVVRLLTNTRKLILCVLLAKADRFGVVQDLGMSELASLVGISKQQLRWHLKILKSSQYLLDYIPGTAVRGVKGKLRSVFILQAKWVRGDAPCNSISLIHPSEAFSFFKRALALVYALEAVNGPSTGSEFKEVSKSQSLHWASIYKIDKVEVEKIIDSARFLRELGNSDVVSYRRLTTFVCELVVMLVLDRGLIGSEEITEGEVTRKVFLEGKKRKLSIAVTCTKLWNMKSLLWFSRLVLKLYGELRRVFARSIRENDNLEIKLCALFPIAHTSSVFLHLSVEPSQNYEELSST